MPKKRKKDAPEGAPMWMVTYGDLMTLLLTFFVLLLSFSSVQETKFHEAVGSLQAAFGVMSTSPYVLTTPSPPLPTLKEQKRKQMRAQMQTIEEELKTSGLEDAVEVEPTTRGFVIRLNNPVLFDSGKADLKPEAQTILAFIYRIVDGFDEDLRVEGHTDNVPISSSRYPSNWELSTARALSVLKGLKEEGIDPTRLTAAGHGEFKPLVSNDSAENRQKNRRVEIHVETEFDDTSEDTPWFLEEEQDG